MKANQGTQTKLPKALKEAKHLLAVGKMHQWPKEAQPLTVMGFPAVELMQRRSGRARCYLRDSLRERQNV